MLFNQYLGRIDENHNQIYYRLKRDLLVVARTEAMWTLLQRSHFPGAFTKAFRQPALP